MAQLDPISLLEQDKTVLSTLIKWLVKDFFILCFRVGHTFLYLHFSAF